MNRAFKLAIIDNDLRMLEWLGQVFLARALVETVHLYSSLARGLREMPQCRPSLVLVEIGMMGTSGIESIVRLKASCPQLRILAHTAHAAPASVFLALAAGVDGFLLKPVPTAAWSWILQEALNGGTLCSPEVVRMIFHSFHELHGAWRPAQAIFTRGELSVLNYLQQGMSNKDIAIAANLATETVRTHLKHIFRKLCVHNRMAARQKFLKWYNPSSQRPDR